MMMAASQRILPFVTVLIAVLAGLLIAASPAQAAVVASYDGCVERASTDSSSTLWLTTPTCTVSLTNGNSEETDFVLTVDNVHPDLLVVTDSSNAVLASNRDGSSATTTITLPGTNGALFIPGSNTATYTVSRWDSDDQDTDFWIGAIGDAQNYFGTSVPNGIFTSIIDWLERIQPDFVTISGDIIRGSSSSTETQSSEYDAYYEVMADHLGSLFPVPGDHDALQDMDTYYSSYFGDRDFSFAWKGVRFIGLSTQETGDPNLGTLTDDQLTWFESRLDEASEETIVVYFHHPLIPPSWAGSLGIDPDQRSQIAQLMGSGGVDLLITGDAHGYDYRTIDEDDFPAMSGSFDQLVTGGAGGRISNYSGPHFLTLIHFNNGEFEVHRLDRPDMDYRVKTTNLNDGSEEQVTFTITNDGIVRVPYTRLLAHTSGSGYAIGQDENGVFYPATSTLVDGVWRTVVEIVDIDGETARTITVGDMTELYTGYANTVTASGAIDLSDERPTAESTPTTLRVKSASDQSTVTIDEWDTSGDAFSWTQTATAGTRTQFELSELLPQREYSVYLNNRIIDRVSTNDAGVASFLYTGGIGGTRAFQVSLDQKIPVRNIGVLPAASGGANYRFYGGAGKLRDAFFAYGQDVQHGYDSAWADVDGDGEVEVVTVPRPGISTHVRVFETDGTVLASFFPFGSTFSGGASIAVADLTGNGKAELVIGRSGDGRSNVRVYGYRAKKKNGVRRLRSFRAFKRSYRGGVEVATGDIDGDGDYELLVAARSEINRVTAYRWRRGRTPKLLTSYNPLGAAQEGSGITLTAADLDFDGDDDLVTGSATGNSVVRVHSYNSKKQRFTMSAGRRAFASGYTGGVQLAAGNLNANNREEVVVTAQQATPASQSRVLRLKGKKQLRYQGRIRPFSADYDGGVSVAIADLDADRVDDILLSSIDAGGRVYHYARTSKRWRRQQTLAPYSSSFSYGILLTK